MPKQDLHLTKWRYQSKYALIYLPLLFLFFSSPNESFGQKDDDRIYRIRVAAARGQIYTANFQKLNPYGVLFFEPADNGYTRVYLGSYIGKSTALRMLNLVKAKGFKSAYLVLDQNLYNSETPEEVIYYTYQLCATRKLNYSKVLAKMDPINAQALHLSYGNGFYKYSLGIYDKGILPQTEDNYKSLAFSMGFTEGFAKAIRR